MQMLLPPDNFSNKPENLSDVVDFNVIRPVIILALNMSIGMAESSPHKTFQIREKSL